MDSLNKSLDVVVHDEIAKGEVRRLAAEVFGLETVDTALLPAFLEEWDKRPNLKRVHDWWDQFPAYCILTPVGRLLARANAERLDIKGILPPLE